MKPSVGSITLCARLPEKPPGGLAAHARSGARTGVHISGFWGAGGGDVTGVALATADGEGGWFAPEDLDPADEQAVAAWLADSFPNPQLKAGVPAC